MAAGGEPLKWDWELEHTFNWFVDVLVCNLESLLFSQVLTLLKLKYFFTCYHVTIYGMIFWCLLISFINLISLIHLKVMK